MLLALMVGQVAVPWWITQHGGAKHLALHGFVGAAASVAGMLLFAPLGDRFPKRRVIGVSLALYAVSALAMTGMAAAGLYAIGPIIALVTVNVLVMAVVWPVSSSFASELVPPAALPRALNLQQGAQATGRLVGPALGGAVLALAGTAMALLSNCLLLAAAALFARRLPHRPPPPAPPRDWRQELMVGLRANWSIPMERYWTLANALSWMFLFPSLTMLVPLKVQSLGLSAMWLGLCEGGVALGMLAGSFGLSEAVVNRFGRYAGRVGGAVVQGLALAMVGFTEVPWLMVAGFFVVGLTNSVMTLVGLTHRTLARPAAFRARMFAGSAMTAHIAGSAGPALAGVALLHWPVAAVYTVFGLLAGGASLALAFVPGFKAFLALSPERVEGWYGHHHPSAFPADAALAPNNLRPAGVETDRHAVSRFE